MLHGNRPEDEEWDNFIDWLAKELDDNLLTTEDAKDIWRRGLMQVQQSEIR